MESSTTTAVLLPKGAVAAFTSPAGDSYSNIRERRFFFFALFTIITSINRTAAFTSPPLGSYSNVGYRQSNSCAWLTTITGSSGGDLLLSPSVYETIESGKIAVVPDFLPQSEIVPLRSDAQNLWDDKRFSTDALASYGSRGKFDPAKDRAVLRLPQWKNEDLGTFETRRRFGDLMAGVRSELAYKLNRPNLDTGAATSLYGRGSTEISYTRFGPGAFLKRHVDEHHEELKGTDGWTKPTRRSISWLIYLNERDWDGSVHGGQLRCFERKNRTRGRLSATFGGDLQVGWLRATALDPYERPVFLDGKKHNHGDCAMYLLDEGESGRTYITKDFQTNPIMYVAGGEELVKKMLIADRPDMARRFYLIEHTKSAITDLLAGNKDYAGSGEDAQLDEELEDVNPRGGTLVLFDSVTLPHEVMATKNRERWACSGWFHEDQQPLSS